MKHQTKIQFYDQFQCTAQKCPFTCCKGWEIDVDEDTYRKWDSNDALSEYLLSHVKRKKSGGKVRTMIDMGARRCCPFLNEAGLCKVVIECGDASLSHTCQTFPRLINRFEDMQEYSLSCACPAVIDIINDLGGKLTFLADGEEHRCKDTPGYRIREAMIAMLQNDGYTLKDRLLLVFHMLLALRNKLVITEAEIGSYQREDYLSSAAGLWRDIGIPEEDSLEEINELFLDIVQNYRKVNNYKSYLKEISEIAEELDFDDISGRWKAFTGLFGEYDQLLENCLVTKIFAGCVDDDIDEMIMAFQLIVTEYVMVRHSAFLLWKKRNENDDRSGEEVILKAGLNKQAPEEKGPEYCDIRDYIVIYSRIIGYNAEGIKSFWKESFDEEVWEFGYMLLLIS